MLHFGGLQNFIFLLKYKTSKMFQNLKSGDLLNFPQKSLGSDFTPSKMFHVSSKLLLFIIIQISKSVKKFKKPENR
jgi:hypothetical protein